jgi:hypothetical protein
VKIRVSDPGVAPSLVSALNETECAAALTGTDTIDVFLPWLDANGEDAENQASAELLFFVRAWGLVHPEFEATVS